jgi:sensor histidine kinase YesM
MQKKILLQSVFWIVVFLIILALSPGGGHSPRAFVFELICVVFYAMVFYVNVLLLFPRYYEKNTTRYILASVALILITFVIIYQISHNIFWNREQRSDRHHKDWFEVFISFRHLFWLAFIYLIGTIYSIQHLLNQQIIHNKKVMEEKLQTELQLLKAQINPHFLFNALNNVYSLTYMKSDKAPDSVLKLSELLRYVIEDCSHEKVALRNEITYMENLIDFYKMKSPGKRKVEFTRKVENMDVHIAPMLFIPFIENSFKYSRIEEDKSGFISILLQEVSGRFHFTIRNSIFRERTILNGSGKGIVNVKQRLDIIYPRKYELKTSDKDNVYHVELEIDLT